MLCQQLTRYATAHWQAAFCVTGRAHTEHLWPHVENVWTMGHCFVVNLSFCVILWLSIWSSSHWWKNYGLTHVQKKTQPSAVSKKITLPNSLTFCLGLRPIWKLIMNKRYHTSKGQLNNSKIILNSNWISGKLSDSGCCCCCCCCCCSNDGHLLGCSTKQYSEKCSAVSVG